MHAGRGLALSFAIGACWVGDLSVDGKQCPCTDGWRCEPTTNLCVPEETLSPYTFDVAVSGLLKQGGDVELSIRLSNATPNATYVASVETPAALSSSPGSIALVSGTAALRLVASDAAPIGPVQVKVTITPGGHEALAQSKSVDLVVAGAPGSLDKSFGEGGVLMGDGEAKNARLAFQPAGILLAQGGSNSCKLRRVLRSGAFDTTFAPGSAPVGTVLLAAFTNCVPYEMITDSAGRIWIGIHGLAGVTQKEVLVRLTPEGLSDDTFGAGGRIETNTGTADALAITAEHVLVAGLASNPTTIVVTRYTMRGQRDPTFGTNGDFRISRGYARPVALAVDDEGRTRMVVRDSTAGRIVLTRLLPKGTLDTSFGTNGWVDGVPDRDWLTAVAQPSRGWMLATTQLISYTADGSIDSAFGGGGLAPIGAQAYGIARRLDGGFVVSVQSDNLCSSFLPNGAPNLVFNQAKRDAKVSPTFGTPVAVDTDGKIHVLGLASPPSGGSGFGMLRVWP